MKSRLVSTVVMCSMLLFAAAGNLLAGETVTFDQENPPFMYLKGDAPGGLYPALVGEAFKRMGEQVKMECYPWKRVIAGADAGEWGVGGIYQNAERLKKYDYSKPIFEEKIMVFALKGGEFQFAGVADLSGKVVGVMRGWSYGDDFDKAAADGKVTKEEIESDEMNFSKLIAGRVDAVLATPETWAGLKDKLDKDGKVVMLATPMTVNKTYLVFNKSAGKTALLEKFNGVIEAMTADGTIEKLAKDSFK